MTILITGANRGLGKDLVQILLKNNPNSKLLLTTRKSPE
jgi:NAD(P)-dependent dehydrogenase (short-subunit alcohol dehydrogenase family)